MNRYDSPQIHAFETIMRQVGKLKGHLCDERIYSHTQIIGAQNTSVLYSSFVIIIIIISICVFKCLVAPGK